MTSRGKRASGRLLLGAVAGLLVVAVAGAFFVSLGFERQARMDADARVQGAIDLMYRLGGTGDPPGDYLLDVLYLANVNDVSNETMNRVADMLGNDNRAIRGFAARALEQIGPHAKGGSRVLPALRRAIAEELAIWKGRKNLIIGAGPTTLDAEMRALGKITGVSLEEVQKHPEQFEKLPPDMRACIETFNQEECDRLMAEWRANPY